jgi:nanoRNase/pAp phosphatase (c-di-AMP/oligoRNAs hydrolase)
MSKNRLQSLLAAIDEASDILILTHNDPDPDAVASALALRYLLAEKLNVTGQIAYHGIFGRAENKALVNYLGCLPSHKHEFNLIFTHQVVGFVNPTRADEKRVE